MITVIAEIGINHLGMVSLACEMCEAAAAAGASAVKTQTYSAVDLWSREADIGRFRKYELSAADERTVARCCEELGIEWLSTPFSPHLIPRVVNNGARRIKLAHGDLFHDPLYEAAIATGLPLLASVTPRDWQQRGPEMLTRLCAGDITALACSPLYPTPPEYAGIALVRVLARRGPAGYSDHTDPDDHTAAMLAVAAGATVVERHVRLEGVDCPDEAVSVTTTGLADLVAHLGVCSQMCGRPPRLVDYAAPRGPDGRRT